MLQTKGDFEPGPVFSRHLLRSRKLEHHAHHPAEWQTSRVNHTTVKKLFVRINEMVTNSIKVNELHNLVSRDTNPRDEKCFWFLKAHAERNSDWVQVQCTCTSTVKYSPVLRHYTAEHLAESAEHLAESAEWLNVQILAEYWLNNWLNTGWIGWTSGWIGWTSGWIGWMAECPNTGWILAEYSLNTGWILAESLTLAEYWLNTGWMWLNVTFSLYSASIQPVFSRQLL